MSTFSKRVTEVHHHEGPRVSWQSLGQWRKRPAAESLPYDIDVASLGIQVMGVTEGFAKRIELMEPSEQAHRLSRQLILPQPL